MSKKRGRRLYDDTREQILVQGDGRLLHLRERLASKRNRRRALPERSGLERVVLLDLPTEPR